MFGRQKDAPASPAPGAPRGGALPADAHLKPSILSEGITLVGDLATPTGILHLDGAVTGTVAVTALTIGPTGSVQGAVTATTVTVKGTVHGEITCDELVLAGSAVVTGAVSYRTLTVQAGATLKGPVTRRTA